MRNKENVLEWAANKNLLKKENRLAQFAKVVEEVGEVGRALLKNNDAELIDGIGDVLVTLIILAAQNNLDVEDCLDAAYEEIKNRKGKTVNGTFIKE
jgi:NTP pyrophosphatase (non-canonical NTP hydrolase)